MNKMLPLAAFVLCIPVFANAGTCAAPTPLQSNPSLQDTTCGGEIGINLGGTIYVHPSNVFSLHLDHAAAMDGVLDPIHLEGTNREMAITTSCKAAPLQVGGEGLSIELNPLTDGDYLLIVSTDPSIPPTNPPICGAFHLFGGWIPVTLQSFTID